MDALNTSDANYDLLTKNLGSVRRNPSLTIIMELLSRIEHDRQEMIRGRQGLGAADGQRQDPWQLGIPLQLSHSWGRPWGL